MRAERDAIPANERAALGSRIEARLLDLPAVREAGTILLFASFGSEIPTEAIAERLLGEGRRVLLPFLQDSTMEAAELRPGQHPVPTAYGPKEPPGRIPVDPAEVDVVVTPGLAFDREGHRVGYGAGHYDGYLRRLGPGSVRIGIGFHGQLLDAVPHGPGDEPLDVIVTDQETIDARTYRTRASGGGE